MEASYLPLELTSIEALNSSLKKLDESMPKVNNKVHLHHGPNSIAIRGNDKATSNGINGVIKPDKTLVDLVREEWKTFKEPYPPHPLLRSGHLQTLYTGYSDSNDEDRVFYARKLLGMYDGGTVGLDFVLESEAQYKRGIEVDDTIRQRKDYVENLPPRIRYMRADEEPELLLSDDDRPMLITLHGLSGGSHELYLRAMLYHITKAPSRWAACSLNARGCGRTSITTRQLFCANWTEDLRTTMKFLKEWFPNRRFYAVGFSLGANILCNYLGEEGKNSPFVAASAISNPWQLQVTSNALLSTFVGRELYSKTMGKNLKRVFMRQYPIMKDHPKIDWQALKKAKLVRGNNAQIHSLTSDFDAAVTAPVFGHKTVMDYYNTASSTNNLPNIKTPTLILHALDDPIACMSGLLGFADNLVEVAIPWDGIAANEYTILAYTHHGGHLGWFVWGGTRWFATAVADFFEMIEKTMASKGGRIGILNE